MTTTTSSRIVWPRPALGGCVFCMIERDTRGVLLDHAQRFNFFPASPLCCVTWVLSGDLHLIDGPDRLEQPWSGARIPTFAFSGAQLGPLVSWNPGESHTITVAFYPDAFVAMTGLDLSAYTGRMVPAEEALPLSMLQPCRKFFESVRRDGVEHGLAMLEREIEMVWAAKRPTGDGPMRWLNDWSRSLAARAALSGPGRSTRQIARRIKAWTGLNERDLQGLGHSEQLYARIHEARQKGDLDWSELAAASGFADQAHMIRRMRQHTGFTPEQLRERVSNDEALWAYRLLGAYFERPKG